MEVYKHICSEVADFNYLFGVITHKYPNDDSIILDRFDSFSELFNKSQVNLRFGLINEEIKELEQAVKDKNSVEIIDALCDILYVVAGAKVYFNLSMENFANMTNTTKTTNKSENMSETFDSLDKNLDIKSIETIVSSNEEVNKLVNKVLNNNTILSNLTELFVNTSKLKYHKLFLNHLIKFYDETLDKIVFDIFEISKLLNINIVHFFDIVHKSNMTKICDNEQDAKDTVKWYELNELRYKEPSYRKINYNDKDYYVIYDMDTKKILKSIKYLPAKFI
jgi:predicted HAD superfamily Cof-like phosphohydrolase